MVFEGCPCCQPASTSPSAAAAAAAAPVSAPSAATTIGSQAAAAPAPSIPPLGTNEWSAPTSTLPSGSHPTNCPLHRYRRRPQAPIPLTDRCLALRTGPIRVGLLTVSDRASDGTYEDKSGPAMEAILTGIHT